MSEQARTWRSRPAAGTFRTRLEITNRSGYVTREYRLVLRPNRVQITYAVGQVSYDIDCDPETGEPRCTCPAFTEAGECKHLDSVLALLEGLAARVGKRVEG